MKCVSFLKNRIHHWSPQPPSSFSPILRQKKTRSFPFHSPSQISSNISTTRWLLEFSLNFKIKKKEKPNFHHTPERIFPKSSLSNCFIFKHISQHYLFLFEYFHLRENPKSKIQIGGFGKRKKKKTGSQIRLRVLERVPPLPFWKVDGRGKWEAHGRTHVRGTSNICRKGRGWLSGTESSDRLLYCK